MSDSALPVAIIGAGPVGLAAAAHLLARGLRPIVLEAGPTVGTAIRAWGHVAVFTPWSLLTDRACVALLEANGWRHPPADAIPTGSEIVARYLEPLAATPALRPHLRLDTRVMGVTRRGMDKAVSAGRAERPFVLRLRTADGRSETVEARAVIDASGTWDSPNPAGADGLPAPGELEAADRIAYGIPDVLGADRAVYADQTVMVLGGGHSALNALIELAHLRQAAPRTSLVWALRKPQVESAFGGEAADALPARGALGVQARALVESGAVRVAAPFPITAIARRGGRLAIAAADGGEIVVDRLIVATGFRPDLSFLREVRLTLDPWLESSGTIGPLIDPNLHSCGTVRPHGARELAHAEPDFYIAGIKAYGRAPTFLMATGYEQVRSIAAQLAGDAEAAARVELALPETGVCTTRPITARTAAPAAASACCAPATPAVAAAASSCCAPTTPEPVAAGGCCAPAGRA